MQFNTTQFYLTKLPGHKFINGINFGVAQLLSYSFANFLLTRMMEMQAFNILIAIGVTSQATIILFPVAGLHIYVANFMLIISAGGQFSSWLLILESRVPPKNSGTFLILSRTISTGMAMFGPSISTLAAPLPHILILSCTVIGFIASRFLPPAGCYSLNLEKIK